MQLNVLLGGSIKPSEITDFAASEAQIGTVTVTWTDSVYGTLPITYDVYENNVLVGSDVTSGWVRNVSGGARTYFVRATNTLGSIDSNTDIGTSYSAPSAPSNFSASDWTIGAVVATFTPSSGYPTPTYDLYQDGVRVGIGISTYHYHTVSAGTRSYYVKAINSVGSANSYSNNGRSLISPITYSFTSNGNVTVPAGAIQMGICLTGGGGSGAAGAWNNNYGGGVGGTQITDSDVSFIAGETFTVLVGSGGFQVSAGLSFTTSAGVSGSSSRITNQAGNQATQANGGAGGGVGASPAHYGQGGYARTDCVFNTASYDGTQDDWALGGGGAVHDGGDGHSTTDGSNAYAQSAVSIGGGGGGAACTNGTSTGFSGNGASGRVTVTFS